MSLGFEIASRIFRLLTTAVCALIILAAPYDVAAQGVRQTSGVPRVGTIKDYPATGLMTGCGNLYFYHAGQATSSDANYVYLARGDGSNAWMNLGGRDVRLRQVRMKGQKNSSRRFYYRVGDLRVTVKFESLRPEDESGDAPLRITITLRRGRAVRIVKAAGSSDC